MCLQSIRTQLAFCFATPRLQQSKSRKNSLFLPTALCICLFLGFGKESFAQSFASSPLQTLTNEIVQNTLEQIKTVPNAQMLCIYVDDTLIPASLSKRELAQTLALTLSSQFGGQWGIHTVIEATQSVYSAVEERVKQAGCTLSLVVLLSLQKKQLIAKMLLQVPGELQFCQTFPGVNSSVLTPFKKLSMEWPSGGLFETVDMTSGWKMQQLPIKQTKILDLKIADADRDGKTELFLLSRDVLIWYQFSPRAHNRSLFSPPREKGRVLLGGRERAEPISRDIVGRIAISSGDTKEIVVRTSDLANSVVLQLQEEKLVEISQVEDWPLGSYGGEIIWGSLRPGENVFTKNIRLGIRSFSLSRAFLQIQVKPQPKGAFFAAVDAKGFLRTSLQKPPGNQDAPLKEIGSQFLLLDLDQNGTLELLSTSPSTPGAGDAITLYTFDEKNSLQKLWHSGLLFASANAAGTSKERPLATITALSFGDVDQDGQTELIAGLHSPFGSSILVLHR